MGKSFGLLHRIFSFSRGSKRSGSNFDYLNPDEYGQDPGSQDPDETLHLTGSVRTTGGIGGLGRGITNAASEMSRSNTAATNKKGGENGLKKRLLRRASLSASDLLSWGHEKSAKRVTSEGGQSRFGSPRPHHKKAREVSNQQSRADIEERYEKHHTEYEQRNNISHYNNRVVEGLALGNGSSKRGQHEEIYLESRENEDLTRLLRTSSANYRVISETDYRDMGPMEHPINSVALSRSTSNPLLSTVDRSAPPTAWTPRLPAKNVDFHSPRVPAALAHVSSISSATSSSTYKVTVHRRRIHSRTSFPEANRALDHLHSSSPITATSTPSISPRSSSDLPEVTPVELTPKNIHFKPSAIPRIRDQTMLSRRPESPPYLRQSLNGRKEPPPSMLPRRVSQRQPVAQKPVHEENTPRRSVVTNSQLYPVAPLRTVPPASHRSTSASLGRYNWKDDKENHTDKPSIKLLRSKGGNFSRTSIMESAFRYQTPLKGSEHSFANEEAYDGAVEKKDEMSIDQHTSPSSSSLTKSSVAKTPIKTRNILKKKRRGSKVSLVQATEEISGGASITSQKSIGGESRSEKNGSRSNLRTILGVAHAVESVIERLHASAVGEQMLASPRRQREQERAAEWDVISVKELPLSPTFQSSQFHSPPIVHKSHSSSHPDGRKIYGTATPNRVTPSKRHPIILDTPRDQVRLAGLRRDPSVVSLLDMYQADGTLKKNAFSNTPPNKTLQCALSDKGVRCVGRVAEVELTKWNEVHQANTESRSAHMRRVYIEALDESSLDHSLIPRPKGSTKQIKQPVTVTNIAAAQASTTLLKQSSNPRGKHLSSVLPGNLGVVRQEDKGAISEPLFSEASALNSTVGDTGVGFASFSSDNEESSKAIDVSLFVEPGSFGYLNDTSPESSPVVETPVDKEIWSTPPEEHYQLQGKIQNGDDVAKEIIPRSPNRRASEIFAFLDPSTGIYSDESFEIGAMSGKEEPGQFSLMPGRAVDDDHGSHAQFRVEDKLPWLMPSFSTPLSGSSPSKRPMGPRTALTFDSNYTPSSKDKNAFIGTSSSDKASHSSTSNIPTSSATPPGRSPPAPPTGATFASDSFASQNTTDRSLYRGIFKFLSGTSNIGNNKLTIVEAGANDVSLEASLGDDRNPFLTAEFDFDKSLPTTPGSPFDDDSREIMGKQNRRAGNFIPLPAFPPISPLVATIVTKDSSSEADDSPTASPCKPKSSVKERIAMWESTKPLEIGKGGLRGRSSETYHSVTEGKSVRWSEDVSKRSGLGDGQGFNIPHNAGRMYGPRASPGKKPTNRPMPQRISIAPAKNMKPADLTQNYPFSQDLFPAILSPGGPAVVKTSNLLQTPQRLATYNDPSPASSSKLGVYGREIMALARSKSGPRAGHDDGKPL